MAESKTATPRAPRKRAPAKQKNVEVSAGGGTGPQASGADDGSTPAASTIDTDVATTAVVVDKTKVEDEFLDKIDKDVAARSAATMAAAAAGGEAGESETGDVQPSPDTDQASVPPPPSTPKPKGRIAGNEGSYSFALCRVGEDDDGNRTLTPTEHTFSLPSVTTLIGDVLGKPANPMRYSGFRIGIEACIELSREMELAPLDYDQVHEQAKRIGVTPHRQFKAAGERGSKAHDVLEQIARGKYQVIGTPGAYAVVDVEMGDTVDLDEYAKGGVEWWMKEHWTTEWDTVAVEVPVWSFDPQFSGTFDLLRAKHPNDFDVDFEIVDYKTSKPARMHKPPRPGEGPAYESAIVQLRFYRIAIEWMSRQPWCPEWLPRNIRITSQRVVLFTADGGYLEDTRSVSEDAAIGIVRVANALREVQ